MRKFSNEEVAFIFGVSRTTVYNWQANGLLPADVDTGAIESMIALRQKEVDEKQAEVNRARSRFRVFETEYMSLAVSA